MAPRTKGSPPLPIQILYKNQNLYHPRQIIRSADAACEGPSGEEEGEEFFYFFRRNPLESPDSDE
jgi:hypothetical protein